MPNPTGVAIVRYDGGSGPAAGVRAADGTVRHVAASIAELLRLDVDELRARLAAPGDVVPEPRLLAPIDGATEVWAAGVTYERSRDARVEESERSATVYEQVYDAARPELFFKAAAWRVAGCYEAIAVRPDSDVDVPEPELAAVLNAAGAVVGYAICNDVSSRSIEGENPLYLPQAKVYLGSCALGPWIVPAWELSDPYALTIRLSIRRGEERAWAGETSTGLLHRKIDELAAYLFRADAFPGGAVLSTGTCLVPDLPFTLGAGDVVAIEIDGIGCLVNPVVRGRDGMRYLVQRQQAAEGR